MTNVGVASLWLILVLSILLARADESAPNVEESARRKHAPYTPQGGKYCTYTKCELCEKHEFSNDELFKCEETGYHEGQQCRYNTTFVERKWNSCDPYSRGYAGPMSMLVFEIIMLSLGILSFWEMIRRKRFARTLQAQKYQSIMPT